MNKVAIVALFGAVACIAFFACTVDEGFTMNLQQKNEDWEIEIQFMRWMAQYEKSYTQKSEYYERLNKFALNYKYITDFQDEDITIGVNEFADMSNEEFSAIYLNGIQNVKNNQWAICGNFYESSGADVPSTFDWREQGAVNEAQNQGMCGSCWAFAAVASLETEYFMKTGDLVKLSEQSLVDCSTENSGCNGGLMDLAFDHVKEYGIPLAADYPYKGKQQTCQDFTSVTLDNGCADIKADNKDYTDGQTNDLARAIMEQGVVSVAVAAGGLPWQFYMGGTMKRFCGTGLNHGIAAVGWAIDSKGQDYWIVRNSWGKSWGNSGYVHIYKGKDGVADEGHGVCGINIAPSYPIV